MKTQYCTEPGRTGHDRTGFHRIEQSRPDKENLGNIVSYSFPSSETEQLVHGQLYIS